MAKVNIPQYSATAASNTDIDSINIDEGCSPANINNAIRELMAHLKDMDAGTVALTSPQFSSIDINGGTVDNASVGATTPSSGAFSTLSATGNVTIDTNTLFVDSSSNEVGIGTASPSVQLHITKSAAADIVALTDASTIAVDLATGQNFSVTLGGNRTLGNPTNCVAGITGSVFVTQDGTGSRTLAYSGYWKFAGGTAPTLSTTAAAVDRIDYVVMSATVIHAVATLNVS